MMSRNKTTLKKCPCFAEGYIGNIYSGDGVFGVFVGDFGRSILPCLSSQSAHVRSIVGVNDESSPFRQI